MNNSALDKIRMADVPTPEQLMEALEHARGFTFAAKSYLYQEYGLNVSRATILRLIREYGCDGWIHAVRVDLVKEIKEKRSA